MPRPKLSLEVIDIATPCTADWDAMRGDDRVRFCGDCSLHVYNLSDMTRTEAEKHVGEHEGRLCVRMYRRADGTVITKECEGSLRLAAWRAKRFVMAGAAFALWGVLAPLGLSRASASAEKKSDTAPIAAAKLGVFSAPPEMGKIAPATRPAEPLPLMGAVACPPATRPVAPATQPATVQRPPVEAEAAE